MRPEVLETTGLGSALLAGLATGVWSSTDEVIAAWTEDHRFEPSGDAAEIAASRAAWKAAVERA